MRNESELRWVCVGLILFQFRFCHFATVNRIENFAPLSFFNRSFPNGDLTEGLSVFSPLVGGTEMEDCVCDYGH